MRYCVSLWLSLDLIIKIKFDGRSYLQQTGKVFDYTILSRAAVTQFIYSYTETVNLTTPEPVQIRKNFWCIEKIRCSELESVLKEVVYSKVRLKRSIHIIKSILRIRLYDKYGSRLFISISYAVVVNWGCTE